MQKRETSIEVKVGALVLFATALLVAFVLVLGDFSLSDGFEFGVEFDNAGGLKPGADVAIAGLNVGNVESLRFIQNPDAEGGAADVVAVRATLRIDEGYADAIRANSEYFISTRGVLGEPYIEIVTEDFESAPLEEGAVVRGVDPPRMDIIVAKATRLLTTLNELLDDPEIHTRELIANAASLTKNLDALVAENRDELDQTVDNVRKTSDEAAKLLAALNVAVDDGEALRATLQDARATARHANAITAKVDRQVDPLLDDVVVTAQNARNLTTTADRVLTENEADVVASIDNLHRSSEDLAALSGDARTLVADVRAGEGTVGALLADREIYDDLKEMLRIIKQKPWKLVWKE